MGTERDKSEKDGGTLSGKLPAVIVKFAIIVRLLIHLYFQNINPDTQYTTLEMLPIRQGTRILFYDETKHYRG
jgi:hypothetical protein